MLKWAIKCWAIRQVNKMLDAKKQAVQDILAKVAHVLSRLDRITALLKGFSARLEDCKLDEQEVQDTVAEIEKTIKEW